MVDATHQLVARAFADVFGDEKRAVLGDLARFLPPGWDMGQVLDPLDASDYLHDMRRALEAEADALAQVCTPAEWLWYTRRVPTSMFRGRLRTTEHADHALMETLTGLSRNRDDSRRIMDEATLRYEISTDSMRPVAHLAALAVVLSQTHAWLRRAGKGTNFVVRDGDFPEPVEDASLEEAITDFDRRIADDLAEQWHPAVDLAARTPLTGQPLLGIGSVESDTVPGWVGPMRDATWVKVAGSYLVLFETLDGLDASIARAGPRSSRWWDTRLPSLVLLLQAMMVEVINNAVFAGTTLPRVAYLLTGREWLTGMLDAHLPTLRGRIDAVFPDTLPETGREVMNQLQELDGQLWPHRRGPVLRNCVYESASEVNDQIVIDVYAATHGLHELVAVPASTGGELVNANAARFEEAVQRTIDGSPWSPDADLRALRRVQLCLNGNMITDLDAIGAKDGTLLIASCKNLTYSPEYDAGEYRVVRNAQTTVEGAVSDLQSVVETLQANPRGTNYDLTRFTRIVGVVVTPHVFFTNANVARAAVATTTTATLRRAGSLGELAKYVAG